MTAAAPSRGQAEDDGSVVDVSAFVKEIFGLSRFQSLWIALFLVRVVLVCFSHSIFLLVLSHTQRILRSSTSE